MVPSSVSDDPWYVRAFDRIYLEVYPHRDDHEAEANADAIVNLLGLRADQRVLDVACGHGRYSRAFARRGLRVTGVDLSEDLIDEARERSPMTPGTPRFIRADFRRLPFVMQFDGAVSLFTSLGYTEDRGDDLAIMQGVHRALVPGARFVVDFLNASQVRRTLEASTEKIVGSLAIRMTRWVDEETTGGPRVLKHVEAHRRDSGLPVAAYEESVRLYTPEDLVGLLEEAGFEIAEGPFADFERTPYAESSDRVVLVGRRGA